MKNLPCSGAFDHLCHYYDKADGRLGWDLCPLFVWWVAPLSLAAALPIAALCWLLAP